MLRSFTAGLRRDLDAVMTVHALREGGARHRVHVVSDGEAALAFLYRRGRYADASRPDLILLD